VTLVSMDCCPMTLRSALNAESGFDYALGKQTHEG